MRELILEIIYVLKSKNKSDYRSLATGLERGLDDYSKSGRKLDSIKWVNFYFLSSCIRVRDELEELRPILKKLEKELGLWFVKK